MQKPIHRWPDQFEAIGFDHQQTIAAIKLAGVVGEYIAGAPVADDRPYWTEALRELAKIRRQKLDFHKLTAAINACLGVDGDDVVAWLFLRGWCTFALFDGLGDREARRAIKAHLGPRPDWDARRTRGLSSPRPVSAVGKAKAA